MNVILLIMSFANFVFYPLVIGAIIAVIIEQILRRGENEGNIFIAMTVRKFLVRQAWIFNIIWFVGYAIILFMLKPGPQQMPDMIWQGGL
tara:strand:+ start:563 stop:832 length:270 start_codon:yes stop_codon:yes gene_type:complete